MGLIRIRDTYQRVSDCPQNSPTIPQVLTKLSDYGLKYHQDREEFRVITLAGEKKIECNTF